MTCPNCKADADKLMGTDAPGWRCAACGGGESKAASNAILHMKFCEGNPGHGPITVAYAREQDSRNEGWRHTDHKTGRVQIEVNRHRGRVIVPML